MVIFTKPKMLEVKDLLGSEKSQDVVCWKFNFISGDTEFGRATFLKKVDKFNVECHEFSFIRTWGCHD